MFGLTMFGLIKINLDLAPIVIPALQSIAGKWLKPIEMGRTYATGDANP
jgi:hypothetical protein